MQTAANVIAERTLRDDALGASTVEDSASIVAFVVIDPGISYVSDSIPGGNAATTSRLAG